MERQLPQAVHAEDTPADPMPGETATHQIRFRNEVAPGTLPRLRFGRYYAFRAWAVDLAGNSRAHELNPQPLPPRSDNDALASRGFATVAAAWRTHAVVGGDSMIATGVKSSLRNLVEIRRSDEADTVAGALPDASEFLSPDVIDTVLSRVRERRPNVLSAIGATADVTRRSLVGAAFDDAVLADEYPFARSTALRDPESLQEVIACQAAAHGGVLGTAGASPVVAAVKTVTPLRPYVRWDPIPSPAIVPRTRYTEGESLRVIVIRSGVSQEPDTLAVTLTDPDAYAAQAEAALPGVGYSATSERHLAPRTRVRSRRSSAAGLMRNAP